MPGAAAARAVAPATAAAPRRLARRRRISAQSKAANPRPHAIFRRIVTDGFKSCFDTAIGKSAKNAADPPKNYGFTK